MEQLNYYKNTKSPYVISGTTTQEWFSLIQGSDYSDLISSARRGDIDYDTTKLTKIPCVTYNFIYDAYKKDSNIISSTGLMYIDIDDPSFDPRSIDRSKVYAMYHSFGGYGWSIVIRIEGLTKKNFGHNYMLIASELGIEEYVDIAAKKASQYNVLSYDPNISINQGAHTFQAQDLEEKKKHPPTVSNRGREKKAYTHGGGVKSTPLRFDSLDEIEFEGDYTVNWEGYDWVRCWIPIKKKSYGRNNLLLSYCNNLLWLNPHLTKERAYKVLDGVNKIAFTSTAPPAQLIRVIESIFGYRDAGTLQPIYFNRKRKIVFKKGSGLDAVEKREIVLALCNEKKANESKQKLYDIIESWQFSKFGNISQSKIHKNFTISKKTVEKYWSEFKEYVKELNG